MSQGRKTVTKIFTRQGILQVQEGKQLSNQTEEERIKAKSEKERMKEVKSKTEKKNRIR